MYIFNSPRLRERKEGLDLVNELIKDKVKCYIIHYSCESFLNIHGRTSRVTSIVIRNLKTAQTKSFSIHLQAQFNGLDFNNLSDIEYDIIEKQMLNEFSLFIKSHPAHKWIHWNMRDSNFGFEAINNRIKILKGKTFEIADDFKFDLPVILGHIYTHYYEIDGSNGKLLELSARNNINSRHAMPGAGEALAFEEKQYLNLHVSTLRKVDMISAVFQRLENGNLIVNAKKSLFMG